MAGHFVKKKSNQCYLKQLKRIDTSETQKKVDKIKLSMIDIIYIYIYIYIIIIISRCVYHIKAIIELQIIIVAFIFIAWQM
jgi:hypothetical protein